MPTLAVSIPNVMLHADFAAQTDAQQSDQTDKFNSDPRGGGWAGGVLGSACIGSAPGELARADCTCGRRLGVSAWLGRGPEGIFVAENAASDELEIIARNLSRIGKHPVNVTSPYWLIFGKSRYFFTATLSL